MIREDSMAVTARAAFDRQLHTLLDDTLLLGSMVEKAIERSIDARSRRQRKTCPSPAQAVA